MLTPGRIYQNSTMVLTATFADTDGNAIDPDTVTFRFMSPTKATDTTYTYGTDQNITRVSAGNYRATFTVGEEVGRWYYRWSSTDDETIDITVPSEGSFVVQYSPFYDDATDYS